MVDGGLTLFRRRQLRVGVLQTLAVFVFGISVSTLKTDLSAGVFPDWANQAFRWVHPRVVCPFCGGTRAFVLCCRGEFVQALHFSLLGTLAYLWLLGTFFWRVYFLVADKARFQRIDQVVRTMEGPDGFLMTTAVVFWLQLTLHYAHLWNWAMLGDGYF